MATKIFRVISLEAEDDELNDVLSDEDKPDQDNDDSNDNENNSSDDDDNPMEGSNQDSEEETKARVTEDPVQIKENSDDNIQGDNNTVTIHEKEYTVYARILNFAVFKNASSAEKHEQWECSIPLSDENAGSGRIRARMVTDREGRNKYELTVKTNTKEGNFESTSRCNKEAYVQMGFLGEKGMKKHRYTFPIPNTELTWEVDLYPNKKGGYYNWIRLEVEVKEKLDKLPELPFEVEEVILPDEAATEEGQKKVAELFDRYFLLPNKYAVKLGKVPSSLDVKPEVTLTDQEKKKMDSELQDKKDDNNEDESNDDQNDQEDNDSNEEDSSNNETDDENKEE